MYLAPIRSLYHDTYLLLIRAQHWGLLGPIRVWEYHPSCQSCHEIMVPWYVAMESPNIDTQQWNWQRTVGSCTQCNGSCRSWGLHCSFGKGLKDHQVIFTFFVNCNMKYPFLCFEKFSRNYILCLNSIFLLHLCVYLSLWTRLSLMKCLFPEKNLDFIAYSYPTEKISHRAKSYLSHFSMQFSHA